MKLKKQLEQLLARVALPAPSGAGAELDADGIHRLRGGNELPAGL